MERIFASGMREFFKLREKRVIDAGALLDGARRAMRASFQRELDAIESQPVVPRLGRLGVAVRRPVRHGVGNHARLRRPVEHAQVTLATVAPGIAEALVATAIGLFAAIPAVIAYNRFARDIDRIADPARDLHRGVLQHPAAQRRRDAGAGARAAGRDGDADDARRRCTAAVAPPHDQRDQHGAVHRRHAGAADHLHGDRAADHHRRRRPADASARASSGPSTSSRSSSAPTRSCACASTARTSAPLALADLAARVRERAGRRRDDAGRDLGRPQRQVRDAWSR